MKGWLKFFGLSFFSDKISKEAKVRSSLNCVLSFLLAVIFIYCGILASNTIPFYAHYGNATTFKSFVKSSISQAELTVENGLVKSDSVVNTYLSEDDASVYSQNGYNLVIDTRSSTALDDFVAYCTLKDGSGEISYEDYLALPDGQKASYTFSIRYTPNELKLTDELIEQYQEYLSTISNSIISNQYKALLENKTDTPPEEYGRKVYALYLKAYYPDINPYEGAGEVPLLRSFYYKNYLNNTQTENSLFIFSDILYGYFKTDGGSSQTCFGSFDKLSNGEITADNANEFIIDAFKASTSISAAIYLVNMIKLIPLIVIIPFILAALLKVVLSLLNDEKHKKFTTCLKIEFSYLAVGGLISAFIMFIFGYLVSNQALSILPLIVFSVVLLIRTVSFAVYEYIEGKKQKIDTDGLES